MESTGVYWIAPHEVLEAEGLEVVLVDTRQLARVPGRNKKTDPSDCEWIKRLHSCGLLAGSFRPPEQVCMLRTLVRGKGNLVAERDLRKLAQLRDPRCRHSEEEIAEELSGHWREDHLFRLRQALQ